MIDVEQLGKDIGDKLVERAAKYLKDGVDPEFLREVAVDMAETQAAALAATTDAERETAEKNLGFLDGTIASFLTRNKIKVRAEAWAAFEDVLAVVGSVVAVICRAALKAALGGLGGALAS